MMNKKIQVWLPLLFSITMIAGLYLGYKMRDNMPGKSFFYAEKKRPIQEIMELIRTRYVDEVNMNDIADTAIQAMLNSLDPHSVYIPAEELQQVNDDLSGKFFGIGVEFNIFDDTLNVTNVLKDGPSFKAGLSTGDKFLKIDDRVVTGKGANSDKFIKLLRGDRGTQVNILVLRGNEKKTFSITRNAIPLSSLDASYMLDKDAGYIRLNKFSSQTYREFMDALMDLKKKGMQKLVLDLRGNGGGLLEEATEIADEFLDGDKLITYTEGRHMPKKEYRCRRNGQFETGPLFVLIDEGTASASEILIGALQDWDRATIIGRRSFGKGLVQEQYDLSDHSAIRLTIAKYYTPIGRSIQRPYNNGEKAYMDDIAKRFHDGETRTADSVKNDLSKTFKTKGGKTVYGGGGISPDLFIPLDTSLYTNRIEAVLAKGTINRFAYQFYLRNKAGLAGYTGPADFATRFLFTEADWTDLVEAAKRDSVSLAPVSVQEKAKLSEQVKTSIARQLWRTEGYFELQNITDPAIKKAKELMLK